VGDTNPTLAIGQKLASLRAEGPTRASFPIETDDLSSQTTKQGIAIPFILKLLF